MLYPVFDFSVYSIKTPIKNIKHFLFDLKCCRDRILKGYCEKDAWDMDRWFLEVVPGVLDCLREQVDSYPSNLPDKQASENGGASCGVQSISLEDDGRLAEWKGILKEMADAFRAADKNSADFVICPTEKAIAERKRAMALLDKYFDDLWN